MPVGPIKDIVSSAPKGPMMALDVGKKTIGVAITDEDRRVMVPLKTIKRQSFKRDTIALFGFIRMYGVKAIVVGWPLNMDGSVGPRAQAAQDFAAALHKRLVGLLKDDPVGCGVHGDPWVALVDERLSTAAARGALEGVKPRKAKESGALDAVAAQVILEGGLAALPKGGGAG